ncbi:MAG TPA: MopE-related protein, partial [Myxococcota bacterium]|nr:MopE-related protein [Myxococcota bacterium]
PCDNQTGVCGGSVKACGGTLGWLDCDASRYGADYQATESLCDGKDNDCDGAIDEMIGALCPLQGGVCAGSRQVCRGTLGWQACGPALYTGYSEDYEASETSCDGLDNDCDGVVDTDAPQPPCDNQVGVCAGSTKTCDGTGGWLACDATRYGADYQATEVLCDGLDNDCDGAIDDPYPDKGKACSLGQGECYATGVQVCNGAGDGLICNAAVIAPQPEICDGLDNDCLGDIDEDYPDKGKACSKGLGECYATGVYVCTPDGSDTTCNAPEILEGIEICDGLDNDCNGIVDDLIGPLCANQDGVCGGARQVCGGTLGWLPCSPATYLAHDADYEQTEASCDGLDNDCDGIVDDDAPKPPCDNQTGVCGGSVKACGG